MIPTLGDISLMLSLLFVVLQIIGPSRSYRAGAISVFILVLFSFLCLVRSYVVSDFSVLNVYSNSSTLKPLLYKITGTWGNHEGSMLLLVLILCGYNLAMVISERCVTNTQNVSPAEYSRTAVTAYLTQLIITAGFLSFIVLTSNPFVRIFPVPENGMGLNPLLQDVGLAMHPPMLYLGYIGFTVAFSYAISALIHGKADSDWAKNLRRWVLTSWGFLTLGIGLGSWWAYRELGWGGFWFWDPVENVSLMPWLAATGLYHSLLVLEKRGTFAVWSVLLAIITFCLSLIGIFLVRSGIVSSVHAFASDPSRGVFIIGFLGITCALAFTLFAMRAGRFVSDASFDVISRESLVMLNNIFFITLSATVLLGTLYPIFLEVFGGTRLSVGAPYFNATFNIIAIIMLVFAAFVPAVNWQSGGIFYKKLLLPLIVGVIPGAVIFVKSREGIAAIAITVAVFLLLASIQIVVEWNGRPRLRKLSRRSYGVALAHAGAAVLVIGVAITTAFGVEKEQVMVKGDKMQFAGYEALLVGGDAGLGKNYIYRKSHFRILKNGNEIANLNPEIRIYPIEQSSTLEADIYYTLFSNIYASVGEIDNEGVHYAARLYYKPMVNLLWLGCVMMASGGLLAAWGRKKQEI